MLIPCRGSGRPRAHVVCDCGRPRDSIGKNFPRRLRTAVTSIIDRSYRSRGAIWLHLCVPLWDVTPAASVYVEAVHRLDELGAVATHVVQRTSREGFDAEWRGSRLARWKATDQPLEVFDEADLDVPLARFDELSSRTLLLRTPQPAPARARPMQSIAVTWTVYWRQPLLVAISGSAEGAAR